MSEKLNWQAPQIEQMSQQESVEMNARDHFNLRLKWADAVSKALDRPMGDLLLGYTDVAARLGMGFPDLQNPGDRWNAFHRVFEGAGDDRNAQLDTLLDFYRKDRAGRAERTGEGPYWPFEYQFAGDSIITMHFGTGSFSQPYEEPGLLSDERQAELRAQLVRMFTDIKHDPKYTGARAVRIRTWLLSRDDFKRLLPPSFTSNMDLDRDRFRGGSRWGQMYKREGRVSEQTAEQFIKNIDHLDPNNLAAAFPYQTYRATAPIEDFYRFYGIS